MNFKEIIEETFCQDQWKYYSNNWQFENLNIENPNDCRRFIRLFFDNSGKAGAASAKLNGLKKIKSLPNERCQHIVYVFLIGVCIYNKVIGIKPLIDGRIQQYVQQFNCESKVNFYFIWFLCCLFHDLGYEKELSKKLDKRLFFQKYQEPIEVPDVFTKKTIKKYWNYRQICHNKNDHGIYAGITMYKSLCKIRSKQEEISGHNEDLCWEKALEHIYNIASWIVTCHNVWFVQKEKKCECEIYEKFNLNDLILGNGEYKINLNDYPLFFFFCLIDTIEPIKKVKDPSLLEFIDLSFSENKIIIASNLKCGCGDVYLNSISGLNDWLIETGRKDNKVTIKLNL